VTLFTLRKLTQNPWPLSAFGIIRTNVEWGLLEGLKKSSFLLVPLKIFYIGIDKLVLNPFNLNEIHGFSRVVVNQLMIWQKYHRIRKLNFCYFSFSSEDKCWLYATLSGLSLNHHSCYIWSSINRSTCGLLSISVKLNSKSVGLFGFVRNICRLSKYKLLKYKI
jgi:hypothetical protein